MLEPAPALPYRTEIKSLPLLTKELVSSVGNNLILFILGKTEDGAHHGRGNGSTEKNSKMPGPFVGNVKLCGCYMSFCDSVVTV